MIHFIQEDIERQKRKTATAIVTSGALTFMILAAALVTASFLMSPVIEDVFGKKMVIIRVVQRVLLDNIHTMNPKYFHNRSERQTIW